jgi:TatD DNase family protein
MQITTRFYRVVLFSGINFMFVDSHCHLDRLKLDSYQGCLEGAMQSAALRGVSRMLCVGINMANAPEVMAIARQYQGVSASVGIHPMDVANGNADWGQLHEWAQSPEVVAIGETGLDYFYSADSAQDQRDSFIRHLALAAQVCKPVIVHTRDARADTISILGQHSGSVPGGVLHCFTESWPMARQALDLGFYISFSGIVTFANAGELREVAKKVPLDRLLIETDSPYLAPVPHRGKSNEPQYVVEVAEQLAKLHGVSLEKLAEITSTNYDKLFFPNKKSGAN